MATKSTAKTKKKAATKKATPAKKKATVKRSATASRAKTKKVTKKTTARKAPAKKKTTAKTATKKKTAAKSATVKAAVKKQASTKKAVKTKTATKTKTTKKAVKAAPTQKSEPKAQKANVGQAPRRTTSAASIPVPTTILPKESAPIDNTATENKVASSEAKQDFKVNDKIVYPAHGVGVIAGLEKQEVAGIAIELFIIDFEQEKMKLRVPTGKAKAAGMRPLSSQSKIKDAIETLKGRARIKRTMWSRRAQEYDAKINSGDIILVAEVVRDLFRAADQPEQSYSERQLFEAALDRMAREVAAVKKVDLAVAIDELDTTLKKKAAAAAAAAATE